MNQELEDNLDEAIEALERVIEFLKQRRDHHNALPKVG